MPLTSFATGNCNKLKKCYLSSLKLTKGDALPFQSQWRWVWTGRTLVKATWLSALPVWYHLHNHKINGCITVKASTMTHDSVHDSQTTLSWCNIPPKICFITQPHVNIPIEELLFCSSWSETWILTPERGVKGGTLTSCKILITPARSVLPCRPYVWANRLAAATT